MKRRCFIKPSPPYDINTAKDQYLGPSNWIMFFRVPKSPTWLAGVALSKETPFSTTAEASPCICGNKLVVGAARNCGGFVLYLKANFRSVQRKGDGICDASRCSSSHQFGVNRNAIKSTHFGSFVFNTLFRNELKNWQGSYKK